jgi:hypothetical protein
VWHWRQLVRRAIPGFARAGAATGGSRYAALLRPRRSPMLLSISNAKFLPAQRDLVA